MTLRRAVLTAAVALLAAGPARGQAGGDIVFGITVGTGERAGLFPRAYPVADVGAELHLFLVPLVDLGTVGVGGGLVSHPFADERVSVAITGHFLGTRYLGGDARRRGLTLDLGYEPFERDRGRFLARAGVAVARRQARRAEAIRTEAADGVWGPWRLRPAVHLGIGRVVAGSEPDAEGAGDG